MTTNKTEEWKNHIERDDIVAALTILGRYGYFDFLSRYQIPEAANSFSVDQNDAEIGQRVRAGYAVQQFLATLHQESKELSDEEDSLKQPQQLET